MTTPPNGPDGWYPDPDQPDPGLSHSQGSSSPKKRREWPWLVLSAIFAVVMVFVVKPHFDEPDREAQLISLCHEAVADRAVAPSTVSFVTSNLAKTDFGWTVSGDLDGQNVFGAMLRSPYACELRAGLEGERSGYYVHVTD